MIRYIITTSDDWESTRYGIAVIMDNEYVDRLDDIVPTFEETAELAAMLQEGGVAAEHFRDVVEDYLAEYRFVD